MNRRDFIKGTAAAVAAAAIPPAQTTVQVIGQSNVVANAYTLTAVTVIACSIYNGVNWVVFSDRPSTLYPFDDPAGLELKRGDLLTIEGVAAGTGPVTDREIARLGA